MKVLVAYYSETGCTKKVADAIYGVLPEEKELKTLGEVDTLKGYDVSFIGFPVHAHRPAKPADDFLHAHAEGNAIALFVTHASPENVDELAPTINRCTSAAAGAQVLGVFDCQGELAEPVMEKLRASNHPDMQVFADMGKFTRGQPDESRLERARSFAKQVIVKVGS